MKIENLSGTTLSQVIDMMRVVSDAELIAQELVNKGALHALETLRARHYPLEQMIENLQMQANVISAECRRRGLPVADELET